MDDNAWVWPDRRELFNACAMLGDRDVSEEQASIAAEALLNDLELYADPDQGQGSWLFPDEAGLASDLAAKLNSVTNNKPLGEWGPVLLKHSLWDYICSDARKLLGLIRQNGQGAAGGS